MREGSFQRLAPGFMIDGRLTSGERESALRRGLWPVKTPACDYEENGRAREEGKEDIERAIQLEQIKCLCIYCNKRGSFERAFVFSFPSVVFFVFFFKTPSLSAHVALRLFRSRAEDTGSVRCNVVPVKHGTTCTVPKQAHCQNLQARIYQLCVCGLEDMCSHEKQLLGFDFGPA